MLLLLKTRQDEENEPARVELSAGGLRLLDQQRELPLCGGSVEYVHLLPEQRAPVLDAVARLGLRLVASSVPWSIHETSAGASSFEGAAGRYRRDLGHFLDGCQQRGLLTWLRLGPAVGLELFGLGIPRRVLETAEYQARGAHGGKVMITLPPAAFAAPSYASEKLLAEAAAWLATAAAFIAPYRYPDGPVVALSLDDKLSFFFRTAAYDQDYHPDALQGFRRYVEARYDGALPAAYGERIDAPRRFDVESNGELARHFDWLDYKESLLAAALGRFAAAVRQGGARGLPLLHGALPAEMGEVISLSALQQQVDAASYDLFALRLDRRARRRALRRARGSSRLPVVGQLQWGAPFWWAPPSGPAQQHDALYALMHGATGLVFHSLVARDRWVDAPITAAGAPADEARYERTRRLVTAIEDLEVLRRRERVEVALLSERRARQLELLSSLVEPLSPAVLGVLGVSPEELRDETGCFAGLAAARRFERAVEDALLAAQIPFDIVEADAPDDVIARYRAVIVPCADVADAGLAPLLGRYVAAGGALLLGPAPPRADEHGRLLSADLWPPHRLLSRGQDAAAALDACGLQAAASPVRAPLIAAVLGRGDQRDCPQRGATLFVANEGAEEVVSTLSGCKGRVCRFWDALVGAPLASELRLAAGEVRMLRCRAVAIAEEEGGG